MLRGHEVRDANDPAGVADAEAPGSGAVQHRVGRPWRALARRQAPAAGGWVATRLGPLRTRLWLLALLVVVGVVYATFASAGWLRRWPLSGSFHDLQADAFRAGQISLLVEPPPELREANNPYDRANIEYWMLDASLYHGKYYSYWGPVPALFQALGKSLLGVQRIVGDRYLAFFSLFVGAWSGALLIERMARRLFGAIPRSLVVLGCLALAFANPALHAASTGSTYYVAIVSGQAWLLAGLIPAFDAVWAETGEARRRHLLLAGLGWSLAIASRVSLLGAVAGLIAVTASLEGWPAERRWRRIVASAGWLGLPVAITGVSLLVYNEVRFDSYWEFGTGVQLSGYPTLRFSSEYVLANLYSYVMRPFEWSCRFPYAFQEWWLGVEAFPKGFPLSSDYMAHEPVVGWLWAVPLCWLSPLAFVFAPRPFSLRERNCR
ncbi:MAG TPA: hypothetical protein VNN80_27550, partial [Polyangiaceae bacterium]|nr:hypothetical protein [Polyangiaceae bacterium]